MSMSKYHKNIKLDVNFNRVKLYDTLFYEVIIYLLLLLLGKTKIKLWVVGGLFDFRVTPNPNDLLDLHLDKEFDNCYCQTPHQNERPTDHFGCGVTQKSKSPPTTVNIY